MDLTIENKIYERVYPANIAGMHGLFLIHSQSAKSYECLMDDSA